MQAWDPTIYGRFEAERQRPSRICWRACPRRPRKHVVDLGCGSGVSTAALRERYPGADLLGIDTFARDAGGGARAPAGSPFLSRATPRIGASTARTSSSPMRFFIGSPAISASSQGSRANCAPGGCLAAQMPDNEAEPTHVLMREIAASERFRAKLAGAGGNARADRRLRRLRRGALPGLRPHRYLAHGLPAPAREPRGDRRVCRGRGPAPVSCAIDARRARRISRALSRGDSPSLSPAAVGRRAAAVPAPVPRRAARRT